MKYVYIGLAIFASTFLAVVLLYNPKQDYFVIEGGTFGQNVFVFITEDTSMVREYSVGMNFDSAACTVEEDGVVIMWFPKNPTKGLLAHEMEHATYMILNRCGVPHTDDTDEVYAYQINYLIDEFYGRR